MARKFLAEAQRSQRKANKYSGLKPRLKGFDLTLRPPRALRETPFGSVFRVRTEAETALNSYANMVGLLQITVPSSPRQLLV
jgi:hypothetical protein